MKKLLFVALAFWGCKEGNVNLQTFQLQSLDLDRAIMVDKNQNAIIISKSGQVLKRVNLNKSQQLPMDKEFRDIEIHDWGADDAFTIKMKFINDRIYYKIISPSGKLHNLGNVRISDDEMGITLVNLCGYCEFTEVYNSTMKIAEGSVNASLSLWEFVLNGDVSYTAYGKN